MGKAALAVLVIVAFIAGLLVSEAPIIGKEAKRVLSGLGLLETTRPETITVTRENTVAVTLTATKTVTKTVEKTVTATRSLVTTIKETITKTVTSTTTRTITVTKTTTQPVTMPLTQTSPAPRTMLSQGVRKGLERLIEGPSPPVPGSPAYTYGGLRLYAGKYLAVRRPRYPGYYVATIYVESHGATRYLVPCCLNTSEMLPPSLLLANSTSFTEYYSARSLYSFLGPGPHTIDVPIDSGHAVECKLWITNSNVALSGCKPVMVHVSGPRLNGYPSLLDAVLESYNETVFEKLRNIVYGGKPPSDLAEAAWTALSWVSKHISYDYAKERERSPAVYSPLQLLEKGKGVCGDYAVFLAAALLAAGAKTAYVIAISLKPIPHAVAAISLNHTMFILDQHLPPIEAGDYAEYLLGNRTIHVYVIKATWTSSGVAVKAYPAKLSPGLDTYPWDRIPVETVEEAISLISRDTGAKPAKELETVIETGNVYTYVDRYLEPLAGITGHPVPIGLLYSPVFDKEWAKTIAATGEQILRQYYPQALGQGSFWLTLNQTMEETRIELYAVPFPEPRITITREGDNLIITIEAWQRVTETSIQLIIYNSDKTVCAAIAPQGYTYPGTTTITATKWTTRQNTVTITLDKTRLLEATSQCTSPVLDIWMNKAIIYSLRIKP